MNYLPVVSATAGTPMAASFITRLKPQGAKTGMYLRQLTRDAQPRSAVEENDRRSDLSV